MKILIIDDEKSLSNTLSSYLGDLGYEVKAAYNGAEGCKLAASFQPDIALLDIYLPDGTGLEFFSLLKAQNPALLVLMITGSATVKTAVEALRLGAEDYLTKPLNLDELQVSIERAAEKLGLKQEVTALKNVLKENYTKDYLFLPSPAMQSVYSQIDKVAPQNVGVLILGETGTGKEHVARLIRLHSPRASKPFVELHCGAFPETLLESELFGYEAGAFTDARRQKKGLFETAQGGTLFLDEVGEMPLTVQAKLLKVLEQKTLRRLGGTQEIVLDVRVISATNRDLEKEVKAGRYRTDLYYRLNVFPILVPSLRERREDVKPLIEFFFREACKVFGKKLKPLSPEILGILQSYSWPGNTRELKNALHRMVLNSGNERVETGDIPPEVLQTEASPSADEEGTSMAESEKRSIEKALERAKGNKSKAAKELGISRGTLQSKVRKYKLE